MTIKEQLNHLARQFPHSKDLAVSLDMVLDYEMEIVGVDTECGLGTGTLTYDLSLGDLPLSGIRRLRKHRRR